MRRGKALREHRSKLLARRKVLSIAERRRISQAKADKRKQIYVTPVVQGNIVADASFDTPIVADRRVIKSRKSAFERNKKRIANKLLKSKIPQSIPQDLPSSVPLVCEFKHFNDYIPLKHLNICHVIESFGLGGAQTMMMELFNGLNKYFGQCTTNHLVGLSRNNKIALVKNLVNSYGCNVEVVESADFKKYLIDNHIDIVLHHRIAISSCLRRYIPKGCKYILLNHTWNSMSRMKSFTQCDAYISVCEFLHNRTQWTDGIHPTRRLTILNGIENDYIDNIPPFDMIEGFRTGRCHRMVSGKFRSDSLLWMNKKVCKSIPNFTHHLIGSCKEAKLMSSKYKSWLVYHGSIDDRETKMSIIKNLNTYFYETFSDEGASVAILESLAAGVPVLCKKYGGCAELVIDGVNGFLCKDRDMFLFRMAQMATRKGFLDKIKETTVKDFNERLHVKHTACKYVQLFEAIT